MPINLTIGIFIVSNTGNIFLVGLMGAGKTTIGKQLAKQLNKTFYDVDHEVEKRTGVKVSVIFDLEGEAGFRKRETAVIDELTQLENCVIATGGGAVLREENRKLLENNGHIIYLRAAVKDLCKRMRYDRQRPLLQNVDVREKLEQLHQERHPIYTAIADEIVDTGQQSAGFLVSQIKKKYLSS